MTSDKVTRCPELHRWADAHHVVVHTCTTIMVNGVVSVHLELEAFEAERDTIDMNSVGEAFINWTRIGDESPWLRLPGDPGLSRSVSFCCVGAPHMVAL